MPASDSDKSDKNGSSDNEESSSDDDLPLFQFKSRGAFKRKANSDEDDDRSEGRGNNPDDSDSNSDDAFNSSPDNSGGRRVNDLGTFREGGIGARAGTFSDDTGRSSDEDSSGPPAPRRRRIELDEAAMNEQAKREALALVASATNGAGERDTAHKLKQLANQRLQEQLRAAARVDPVDRSPPLLRYAPSAAAREGAASSSNASRRQFERLRMAKKSVRLVVVISRGSGQRRHKFRVKLEKTVEDVLSACRREFLSAEEREQGVELSLHRGNKLLDDPTQQLMDAGITEDTELRLEVAGEAGGFAGPPITLKVRIDLKEFVVETRKGVKFSAFMESFCYAVGVPEGREQEVSFFFDGTKLAPDRTPEEEEMDEDDLVDAEVPSDLKGIVQSAPSAITLMAKPIPKEKNISLIKEVAKSGPGKGSTTMEESASSAVALGRERRMTRSTRGQTSRGAGPVAAASAAAATEHDVVVLSD